MSGMRKLLQPVVLLWATVTVTLAYTGVKLVPQLVVLGLVLIVGGLQGLFWRKSWRRLLVAPLIVLMFLGASMVSFIQLGLWLFPPVTSDGHGLMPIGQTFVGIALGFAFCVLLCWLYFARFKPDERLETVWTMVTFVVLATAFLVDLFH
jgi:hypothetical protein